MKLATSVIALAVAATAAWFEPAASLQLGSSPAMARAAAARAANRAGVAQLIEPFHGIGALAAGAADWALEHGATDTPPSQKWCPKQTAWQWVPVTMASVKPGATGTFSTACFDSVSVAVSANSTGM